MQPHLKQFNALVQMKLKELEALHKLDFIKIMKGEAATHLSFRERVLYYDQFRSQLHDDRTICKGIMSSE